MAPRGRGRPRKRGNTRMDAALDAMSPLGFPEKCVRQTIKELLKVYGGDDGWVFIEEAAYKLLIDTILDNQKNVSTERDAAQDDARSIKDAETSIAWPSLAVIEPNCSKIAAVNTKLHSGISAVSTELTQLPTDIAAKNTKLLTAANVTLDSVPHGTEGQDFQAQANEADLNNKHMSVKDSETYKNPMNAVIQSPKLVDFFAPRKRKPYHGWICNDKEEDFMYLTPEPLPEALKKFLTPDKKRNSRWDVRPDDVNGSLLSFPHHHIHNAV